MSNRRPPETKGPDPDGTEVPDPDETEDATGEREAGDDEPAAPAGPPWTRSLAWANTLRGLTVLAFLLVVFLAFRLVTSNGDPEAFYEHPRFGPRELPVFDAIALETSEELLIRGFVFDGPGFRELRLCNARTREDPPGCLGPFVSLEGVDRNSFGLTQGTTEEGEVFYSERDVLLKGILIGTLMQVTVVLGT